MSMATAFPSCSSSTTNLRLPIRPQLQPPASSISGHHSFLPKLTGLKIQSSSRHIPVAKAFRRPDGTSCEASETALNVPTVRDGTWKSLVLEADCPVLIEFWAPWCGPCHMLHPVVGELSRQYMGRVKCFNLNADDCPSIATEYGIRSIPTIMIFVNGEKKDAIKCAVPKTTLTFIIEKFL